MRGRLRRMPAEPCPRVLDVQAEQVLAEDLPLRLAGQLGVPVAGAEVFGNLEVHEGPQRPLRVEDRRLGAVDDLVFAAPEQQLPDDLGEHPRAARSDSRSVVHASSQTISTSAAVTPGCASILSWISVRTREAKGPQPDVSSNSTRTWPPAARTERTSPISPTDMPFSRQHGS